MICQAQEVIYWPGMQIVILQESTKCSLCASYGSALPREPIFSHEIPQRPWKFILQDLFKQGGHCYSVTFCYCYKGVLCPLWYTRYIVVRQWSSVYLSGIFEFFQDLSFQVDYPYYAGATSKAEAGIKKAKKMLKKNQTLPTGLLDGRNTLA